MKTTDLTLQEQTKFCLNVLKDDLKLGNIDKLLMLAEKEKFYDIGIKPSILAATLVYIKYPEKRRNISRMHNVTNRAMKKTAVKVIECI